MIDTIFDGAKDRLNQAMEKHINDIGTPEVGLRARKQLDAFIEFVETIYSESLRMVRQIKETVNGIDKRIVRLEQEQLIRKDCDYCEINGKTFFDKADYYVIQRVKVAGILVGVVITLISFIAGWWMVGLNNTLVKIQNTQVEMMSEIRHISERVVKNETTLDYHIKEDNDFKAKH